MKKTIFTLGLIMISSLMSLSHNAVAHHSFAMFDNSKEQMVIGRVVRWAFNNPHSWLYIEAEDSDGNLQTWGFEGAAQIHAMRQGVNGNTFKVGELVKVVMHPLVSGEPAGAMCFVEKEDGTMARPNDGICDSEARIAAWQANNWMGANSLTVYDID